MMNFAAIDFETATGCRNSACSVAVTAVEDGRMKDVYYSLIQPPMNKYNYFNIQIHGITPNDTKNVPTFAEIWPELKSHLEGKIVVAHNAKFDMGVLSACLADEGLPTPDFAYCDTVAIARKAWPFLENHKLDTVGTHLHIDFQHHNAMDDARTCAAIPLAAGQELKEDSLESLAKKLGINMCVFGRKGYRR